MNETFGFGWELTNFRFKKSFGLGISNYFWIVWFSDGILE